MASFGSQDPLDVLQSSLNDVLVQIGKAIRASRRDHQGNVAPAHGSLQKKFPETVETFHNALDEIESEIISAKSVLQRDLEELRQRQQPAPALIPQQPEPIESQSKSPMVIDIDSSSPVVEQHPQPVMTKPQMAPFPDMGMGLPDVSQPDMTIKEEPAPSLPIATMAPDMGVKSEAPAVQAPMAPMPLMDQPMGNGVDMSTGADTTHMPDGDLNFTNMEFTLAPTNGDSQMNATTQEPSFDLTTFAPTDADDFSALDDLLAQNVADQSAITTTAPTGPPPMAIIAPTSQEQQVSALDNAIQQPPPQQPQEEIKEDKLDSAFDDLLMDTANDYGMDTFNDLIDDRDDNTFSLMEHGDFDNQYFGLDQVYDD